MTPFFIQRFKKENKCPACPAKKGRGYSMCLYHIAKAREYWHKWVSSRQSIGRCISCDRKNHKDEQRCRTHKELNRQKCAKWMAKYGAEYNRRQWHFLKTEYRDRGFCPQCPEHRPLAEGKKRCGPCRERQKMYHDRSVMSRA